MGQRFGIWMMLYCFLKIKLPIFLRVLKVQKYKHNLLLFVVGFDCIKKMFNVMLCNFFSILQICDLFSPKNTFSVAQLRFSSTF